MEDNCRPFFVDPASRIVGTPSDAGTIAVASDEMVRPIRIALPRWYHGTDLGEFALRVNYRNAEDEEGVYLASDKVVGDDSVTFEWLLSRHVTQAAGPVRFSVCAVRHAEDGLTVAQEFNSRPAAFEVIEGLEVDEDAELEARLDWVWKVVADCEEATNAAKGAADYVYRVAANAIKEAQASIKVMPDEPKVRGDGMLWMQTDEAASEIVALKRWDADDRGRGLLPSKALLPGKALLPKDKGTWKEFKLAASTLA
ncbi:hypothetical protein AALA69_07550 [Eggerthellaceae bacterium 24-137]